MAQAAIEAMAIKTLDTQTSTVRFSSINQDFTHLWLVVAGEVDTDRAINLEFNDDAGTNYATVLHFAQGSSALSEEYSSQTSLGGGAMQPAGVNIYHIFDYSATDKTKTILHRRASTTYVLESASRYASTTAITSIDVTCTNMQSGTTIGLWGVRG